MARISAIRLSTCRKPISCTSFACAGSELNALTDAV